MLDAIVAGTVTKEEVAERMPQLRAALVAAKAALTTSKEPPKIISMHPKIADQYLADLDRLDQLIAGDLSVGDDGLAKALRQILTEVSVLPAPIEQPPEVKITGYLETLIKQNQFDERSGGGERGSGGGDSRASPSPLGTLLRHLEGKKGRLMRNKVEMLFTDHRGAAQGKLRAGPESKIFARN